MDKAEKQVNVLVVDDEEAIREMLTEMLSRSGMDVSCAADAKAALLSIDEKKPDIILLDWMMPGMSGPQLTRRLRKEAVTATIPIIMLTAKVFEDDRVTGLNAGADDYISKPFSSRELVARINAVMRRSQPGDAEGRLRAGRIVVDTASRQVLIDDEPTHLGPTEYRLLEFFITHPNRAFSRSQLLDHVWGTNAYLEERTVDVHIRRLRKILQVAAIDDYVQTVRGHGYRFAVKSS